MRRYMRQTAPTRISVGRREPVLYDPALASTLGSTTQEAAGMPVFGVEIACGGRAGRWRKRERRGPRLVAWAHVWGELAVSRGGRWRPRTCTLRPSLGAKPGFYDPGSRRNARFRGRNRMRWARGPLAQKGAPRPAPCSLGSRMGGTGCESRRPMEAANLYPTTQPWRQAWVLRPRKPAKGSLSGPKSDAASARAERKEIWAACGGSSALTPYRCADYDVCGCELASCHGNPM
jgi:hypothetical protein